MKNLFRSSLIALGLFTFACGLHAQTIVENDSTQPQLLLPQEEYCEVDSISSTPQDTISDKGWKLRIDLKNWIIQIRKDQ